MSIACPNTRHWLRLSFDILVKTACRPVSTTSAIKRGLRAEKAGRDQGQGRGRPPQSRRYPLSASAYSRAIGPHRGIDRGSYTGERSSRASRPSQRKVSHDVEAALRLYDRKPKVERSRPGSLVSFQEPDLPSKVEDGEAGKPAEAQAIRIKKFTAQDTAGATFTKTLKRSPITRNGQRDHAPAADQDGAAKMADWYPRHNQSPKTSSTIKAHTESQQHAGTDAVDPPSEKQQADIRETIVPQANSISKEKAAEPPSTSRMTDEDLEANIRSVRDIILEVQRVEGNPKFAKSRHALDDRTETAIQHLNATNKAIMEGRVSGKQVERALKGHLSKPRHLWGRERPDGEKTIVWWKRNEKRLELVPKGTVPDAPMEPRSMKQVVTAVGLPDNATAKKDGADAQKVRLPNETKMEAEEAWDAAFRDRIARAGALMREEMEAEGKASRRVGRKQSEDVAAPNLLLQKSDREIAKVESPSSPRRVLVHDRTARPSEGDEDAAVAVPYSTAASTFLYGSNTVLAALQANRRKFYHLYLSDRVFSREGNAKTIRRLAKERRVRMSPNTNLRLLDKMANNRPHNGVVLEASRVSAPPVLALGKLDESEAIIPLEVQRQSAEDVAVNGAPVTLPSLRNSWRHPFILILDGIKDEGNMGNIIRTAHFYGVDAVAIATNTCANINSSVVAKASSGAVEAVPILSLPSPAGFVHKSAKAGWKIYGAVPAPPPKESSTEFAAQLTSKEKSKYMTTSSVAANSPLAKHSCILMLGAEDEGLRDNLKDKADQFVSIVQGERVADSPLVGVDSVNVGVAAGVLVESFMRRPEGAKISKGSEPDTGRTDDPNLGF